MLLVLSLLACDLTQFGAYTCDDYCEQVLLRTETCTQAALDSKCEELGGTPEEIAACKQMTEGDVSEYAAQGQEDWAGQTRAQMVESCNADIAEAEKSDASCQAETATINNITCDDLIGLISALGESAN